MQALNNLTDENSRNAVHSTAKKEENIPIANGKTNIIGPLVIIAVLIAVTLIIYPKIKAWWMSRKSQLVSNPGSEVTNE